MEFYPMYPPPQVPIYPPALPEVTIIARLNRLEDLVRQLLARPALNTETVGALSALCEALQAPPPTLPDSGYSSGEPARTPRGTRRPTPRRNKRVKSSASDLWSEPTPGNWTGSSVEFISGQDEAIVMKRDREVTFSDSATSSSKGTVRPRSQRTRKAAPSQKTAPAASDTDSEWKTVRPGNRKSRSATPFVPTGDSSPAEASAGPAKDRKKKSQKSRRRSQRVRATIPPKEPALTPAQLVDREASRVPPKSSRTEEPTTDDKRVPCSECKKLGFWSFGVCGDCQVSARSLSHTPAQVFKTEPKLVPHSASRVPVPPPKQVVRTASPVAVPVPAGGIIATPKSAVPVLTGGITAPPKQVVRTASPSAVPVSTGGITAPPKQVARTASPSAVPVPTGGITAPPKQVARTASPSAVPVPTGGITAPPKQVARTASPPKQVVRTASPTWSEPDLSVLRSTSPKQVARTASPPPEQVVQTVPTQCLPTILSFPSNIGEEEYVRSQMARLAPKQVPKAATPPKQVVQTASTPQQVSQKTAIEQRVASLSPTTGTDYQNWIASLSTPDSISEQLEERLFALPTSGVSFQPPTAPFLSNPLIPRPLEVSQGSDTETEDVVPPLPEFMTSLGFGDSATPRQVFSTASPLSSGSASPTPEQDYDSWGLTQCPSFAGKLRRLQLLAGELKSCFDGDSSAIKTPEKFARFRDLLSLHLQPAVDKGLTKKDLDALLKEEDLRSSQRASVVDAILLFGRKKLVPTNPVFELTPEETEVITKLLAAYGEKVPAIAVRNELFNDDDCDDLEVLEVFLDKYSRSLTSSLLEAEGCNGKVRRYIREIGTPLDSD